MLTGFLGAGKTTVLNHLLSLLPATRIGVIENECGAVGVDGDLVVSRAERVAQLANGCICCTIRADLVETLQRWREAGTTLDHIVVETSGLADPTPIVRTLFASRAFSEWLELAAVVSVADARHLHKQLDRFPAAREQLVLADMILLNKADLATRAELQRARRRIRRFNPFARLRTVVRGRAPANDLLGLRCYRADARTGVLAPFASVQVIEEVDAPDIITLTTDKQFSAPRLYRWLGDLFALDASRIYRLKGLLQTADDQWHAVHAVHDVAEGVLADPPRLAAESRLVIIGDRLDRAALNTAFQACFAERARTAPQGKSQAPSAATRRDVM